MISDTTYSPRRQAGRRLEWPRAVADCLLPFAAAPSFAIMAILAGIQDGDMPNLLCSAQRHASPLTGMASMYLLMSAFHSTPWLKLISSWLARRT
jgi:hypothetical protein